MVEQGLSKVLIATIRDERVIRALMQGNAQTGEPFSMEVGGFAGPASGTPVQIDGVITYFGKGLGYDRVAIVEFADHNSLIITPALDQVILLEELDFGSLPYASFNTYVVKSRVHFRRGFDETGFAKTIIIVEAPGSFIGTTRLDALLYRNIKLTDYYPYGTPPDRAE